MASTLVQIRVDEDLKNEAASIYERLGLDLPTAIRVFLKKSVEESGIPFSLKVEKKGFPSGRQKGVPQASKRGKEKRAAKNVA